MSEANNEESQKEVIKDFKLIATRLNVGSLQKELGMQTDETRESLCREAKSIANDSFNSLCQRIRLQNLYLLGYIILGKPLGLPSLSRMSWTDRCTRLNQQYVVSSTTSNSQNRSLMTPHPPHPAI